MSIDHEVEIIRESFGLSIFTLFSSVCGRNAKLSFEEKKSTFFTLLEKLLRDRLVILIAPGADCYVSPSNPKPKLTVHDPQARWSAPVEEIMSYVRGHWPNGTSDENDVDLIYYFYELPGLVWLDSRGFPVVS